MNRTNQQLWRINKMEEKILKRSTPLHIMVGTILENLILMARSLNIGNAITVVNHQRKINAMNMEMKKND